MGGGKNPKWENETFSLERKYKGESMQILVFASAQGGPQIVGDNKIKLRSMQSE